MNVKQISLHSLSAVRRGRAVAVTLCALCTGLGPSVAQSPAKTPGTDTSTVHLLPGWQTAQGAYQAGIAIDMAPGWHTYWKTPGDAGIPPVIVFTGSSNIAKSDVLFPVPSRITDDGLQAYGYNDSVILPVTVMAADPAKPVVLHFDMNYAVCNQICVPAHASASLTLPVKDGEQNAAVTTAFAALPKPLEAAEQGSLALAPVAGTAKPTWTLRWTGQTPIDDIFVDAPEGYAFDAKPAVVPQPKPPQTWTLVATVTDSGNREIPIDVTLAGRSRSFVAQRVLALPTPTAAR